MEVGRGLGVEGQGRACSSAAPYSEEEMDLRRGPWTVEEDFILGNYIANHGEGRWNSLARCAGLKRTGKSCRLRWLNYLRPDVRRGNITPEEQLLILELHSLWGNRWSKIAQHLPGRTDNEIKNYWRTRVQKHAKQLRCDVNSKQFKDLMRYIWMPRLLERIRAASSPATTYHDTVASSATAAAMPADNGNELPQLKPSPENSSMAGSSSDSLGTQLSSPPAPEMYCVHGAEDTAGDGTQAGQLWPESFLSPGAYGNHGWPEFAHGEWGGGDAYENFWSLEDDWFPQQ